jgi:hypothetical protein
MARDKGDGLTVEISIAVSHAADEEHRSVRVDGMTHNTPKIVGFNDVSLELAAQLVEDAFADCISEGEWAEMRNKTRQAGEHRVRADQCRRALCALIGEHQTREYVESVQAFIRQELCAELFGRPFIDTPAPHTTSRHP